MVLQVRISVKFGVGDGALAGGDHRARIHGADDVLFFELCGI